MSEHQKVAGGMGTVFCSCGQTVKQDDWTVHASGLDAALVDAIDQWMRVPTEGMQYAHGNAQGIARALAVLRGTTFSDEWVAGLDRYQNTIVTGSPVPPAVGG
jgi:hypothetical protein